MKKKNGVALLAALIVGVLVTKALALQNGFIDMQKILAESIPGQAGVEHMRQVDAILTEDMERIKKLHTENHTPDADEIIAHEQMRHNRMHAEQQKAVDDVLDKELRIAMDTWLEKNENVGALLNKPIALVSRVETDYTDGVMAEMDARVPVFPPLPEFTVPEKNKSVVSAPVESDDVPAPAPEKKEIPSTAELDAKIDALLARYGYPK